MAVPLGMYLWPVFLVISCLLTFIVNYSIAVSQNHTDVFLPYISDTAATPPESCTFGLMTCISALASVGTMYARLKFNSQMFERRALSGREVCNHIAFGVGLCSCLGMCMVGTFQETITGIVGICHRVGAVLFFVLGVVYIIIQAFILWHPDNGCAAMFCIRLFIATIACLAAIPMFVCIFLMGSSTQLHWTGKEKDYDLHIASAGCEWLVALCFVLHFSTYIYEFKGATITVTANLENGYIQHRNSSDEGHCRPDDS